MYVLSTSTRARRRQDSLLPHAKASPSRLFVDAVEIRPKRKLRTEVTRRPHLARSKRVAAVFVPSRTFPRAWHEVPESTRWPFSPGVHKTQRRFRPPRLARECLLLDLIELGLADRALVEERLRVGDLGSRVACACH